MIKATMIGASLTNASCMATMSSWEYLECEILRKTNGDAVTIGDIISGDYMSTLLGGKTPD